MDRVMHYWLRVFMTTAKRENTMVSFLSGWGNNQKLLKVQPAHWWLWCSDRPSPPGNLPLRPQKPAASTSSLWPTGWTWCWHLHACRPAMLCIPGPAEGSSENFELWDGRKRAKYDERNTPGTCYFVTKYPVQPLLAVVLTYILLESVCSARE